MSTVTWNYRQSECENTGPTQRVCVTTVDPAGTIHDQSVRGRHRFLPIGSSMNASLELSPASSGYWPRKTEQVGD